MTQVSPGRPTTDSDRFWKKFGDSLTPDKQLDLLSSRADKIVSRTSLVGTVLGAGGLVAISTILTDPSAQLWAIWAVAAAAGAVLLALVTEVQWRSKINAGNLVALRDWYERYSGWRRNALSIASLLLVAAFVLGAASVVVALTAAQRQPSISLLTVIVPGEDGGPKTLKATATAQLTTADELDSARAVLKSDGDPVAGSSVGPGADSSLSVTLEAEGLAPNSQITFTFDSTDWSCEVSASKGSPEAAECSAIERPEP